jgi:hypothetical protein
MHGLSAEGLVVDGCVGLLTSAGKSGNFSMRNVIILVFPPTHDCLLAMDADASLYYQPHRYTAGIACFTWTTVLVRDVYRSSGRPTISRIRS